MTVSEHYYELTGKRYVYNIMPIENIPSVLKNGIMCFNQMKDIGHISIAMSDVQKRRSKVVIPNGLPLHEYANLYFSYNNAMLYIRKERAKELCILSLAATVLDIKGCIITDRNAATSLVRFYSPEEGLKQLDFEKIHAQYWNHDDPILQRDHKAVKCAEILIPNSISADYLSGAYVVSDESKSLLLSKGFNIPVYVKPAVFYQ